MKFMEKLLKYIEKIKKQKKSKDLLSFTDLKVGDYVVHEIHGVAQYKGISKREINGTTRDFLTLEYRGEDKLLVPTDQMDVIQKFIGSKGEAPRLTRLGSGEWQRIKQRAKKLLMRLLKIW